MRLESMAVRPDRYAAALGLTILIAIAGLLLSRLLDEPAPLLLFSLAVIVSAWYGGLGPGLLSTALSGAIGSYLFLEPQESLAIHRPIDWVRLGMFLFSGATVSWLSETLHRARRQADTERTRLQTVLENIPAGVAVAEAPSGRIALSNPQAERILGHSLAPIPDVASYQSLFGHHVNGSRLQAQEYPLARALRGETLSDQELLYQKDGEKIWLRVSSVPIRDTTGGITGGVVLFADITGEKQAAEALRASEQRLDLALAAARLGIWHLDLGTGEMTCSAACKANFGRPQDVPFNYPDLLEAIHPDDRDGMQAAVRSAIEGRVEYRSEYRVLWPDGSLHWIAARGRATYDEDGRPVVVDGVTLDFTERKSLEDSLRRQSEALQEADRHKDEFLATLAHELRNPLAPLQNALQILALRGQDPGVVTHARELMERQVRQITRLVDDLMEVSRISRGKVKLQSVPLDLAGVVTAAAETSRPLIEARRHELTVTLPERPVRVEGDPARLAQVLANLLNNAAKYTEVGGRIDLTLARQDGQAVFRVRDTGVGISPEMLPRVFDLFTQVDGTLERAQGGLGIGLTLVRRLVELHGGTVEAHSDGLGRGSELVVRLPALDEEGSAASPEPAEVPALEATARRVLVVDDNVDSAESLALLLQLHGHEVRLAHDGEAALEEARAFRPGVMLLDIGLPKLDGYTVARRLREERDLDGLILVAMTGYGQDEDRRRSREAGFHHHLLKPLDLDALQALLAGEPRPGMTSRAGASRSTAAAAEA